MTNIKSPAQFQKKLEQVMNGIYELMELAKEHDLAPVSDAGVTRYLEDDGKTCFQAAGQFDRPSEFLQTLLDIIRVNFEPRVLGTLFLNSNMDFLYEGIPNSRFQLGYVSLVSAPDKEFPAFWHEDVVPHIDECGYTMDCASAIYAVASAGDEKYGFNFVNSVSATLDSGFPADEVLDLMAEAVSGAGGTSGKLIHAGYCVDPALETRIRLSLWLFLQPKVYAIRK